MNARTQHDDAAVETSKNSPRPRLVSLFSGCGGLDLGFRQAGFDLAWANDVDADARHIHELNVGPCDGRDIRGIQADEVPDCDAIAAGFPCQPFSNAGNRGGTEDPRGALYLEVLRMVAAKRPAAVVLENVKGLKSMRLPDRRGTLLIDDIVRRLEDIGGTGYNVAWRILNAADYGVPQLRERFILVGIRRDLHRTFAFPDPRPRGSELTLRHVLAIPDDAPNRKDWPLSPQALAMARMIPEGENWKVIPYAKLPARFQRIRDQMAKYRSPCFYRRFHRDEICGTITASAQPENCGILHPTQDRRYDIREIARIQSFPDDFVFVDDTPKQVTGMYKVIGNAVPPGLARAIAREVLAQAFGMPAEAMPPAGTAKAQATPMTCRRTTVDA
jgi:DNA (cytosine-5)-methyltransferase 1